jgi:hypothetical protein
LSDRSLRSRSNAHRGCTAFKQTKLLPGGATRFAFTCEHGPFEVDVNFDAAGRLGGFTGRSPGSTPPASVSKLFAAAVKLHFDPTWSDADYKRVFPKKQIPEAQERAFATQLQAQFGTCKPGAFIQEGTGWTLDLKCSKGGAIALSIQLDKQGELEGIQFHPPATAERQRCPMK